MPLNTPEISKLNRIIKLAESLWKKTPMVWLKVATTSRSVQREAAGYGVLVESCTISKMLKAERKRGVPVAEMARKHRIRTAYIHMLWKSSVGVETMMPRCTNQRLCDFGRRWLQARYEAMREQGVFNQRSLLPPNPRSTAAETQHGRPRWR